MRVLVVSNMYPSADSPAFGVFVKRITEQKVQAGLQVQLVARQGDKGNKLLSYLGFYWRAFWAVIFSRHDVVYLHFATHSYPPVGLALLFRSLPLVVHVHGADVVPENPAKKLRAAVLGVITARALAAARLIVAPSAYFRDLVCSLYPVPPEKVFVSASGGVDTGRFAFSALPAGPRRLLFLGRLISGKGAHQIIPALQLVLQRDPSLNVTLVFAGDGPLRPQLEEQARRLPAQLPVEFLGMVDPIQVPATLASCHLLVFPSFRAGESLGLTALEAMACGRPVVAARSGAMSELVTDRINGLKFEPGNIESMAAALQEMLACSDAEWLAMSQAARAVAEQYSGAVVAPALHERLALCIGARVPQ